MTMKLKGINTGSIKQNNRFIVMTFKIKGDDDSDKVIYMKVETLIDFLMYLRYRMLKVTTRAADRGEIYKSNIIATSESLMMNIPQISVQDVNHPDQGNLVMSFAPKSRDEDFTLIAMLQNEQIFILTIDDTQVEFIILAIQQALTMAEDNEAIQLISSILDFLLLYTLEFTESETINYHQFSHDQWKMDLFSHHVAILHCYDTDEGKKFLTGAVIKTDAQPGSAELEGIIARQMQLVPTFIDTQNKVPLSHAFSKVIPSAPGEILTIEACLQPVKSYYAESRSMLNR